MAMEFVAGRSLKELMEGRGAWPLLEALDLAKQLLEALDFFHDRGVVHRDIKPANLMVDAARNLTVTDFGIAYVEASDLTRAGTILGTPSYMSPEQVVGLPVDRRSDLFAVGVILYELLTGTKPFRGEVITVTHKIVNEPHPDPSAFNATLPAAVDALFRKALAKKPEDRFQNGAEFRAALEQMVAAILRGDIVPAAPQVAAAEPAAQPQPLAAPPAPAAAAAPVAAPVAPAPARPAAREERKSFESCPACGKRFGAALPWNAVCPGCGRALFEAAQGGGRAAADPGRSALSLAVLAAVVLVVVVAVAAWRLLR
jgi:serine/threonine-protein kinase